MLLVILFNIIFWLIDQLIDYVKAWTWQAEEAAAGKNIKELHKWDCWQNGQGQKVAYW